MQKVLITAGASGIGYTIAERFSDAGHQIWIIDISREALKKCPKDWEKSNLDVCDENAMSALFDKINEKLNNDNFMNKASDEIIEKFKNDAQNHKSSIEKIDQIINTIN